MRFVTAACLGIAGILTGLLLGYALWGQHMADLAREVAKTNEELVTTKGWLLDEIEWSDERQGQISISLLQVRGELARITERHEQVSAALTNARAELLHVRGELTRITGTQPRTDGTARRLGNDNNWSASPNANPQRR
jgi:hypothetical protein